MAKYLFLYQELEDFNSIWAKLENWDDDLPISDWLECIENKNRLLYRVYDDVPNNFVLGQIGDDLNNGLALNNNLKAFFDNEDPEKMQLLLIKLKFDKHYNIKYYDNIIKNLIIMQNNYNNQFKNNV